MSCNIGTHLSGLILNNLIITVVEQWEEDLRNLDSVIPRLRGKRAALPQLLEVHHVSTMSTTNRNYGIDAFFAVSRARQKRFQPRRYSTSERVRLLGKTGFGHSTFMDRFTSTGRDLLEMRLNNHDSLPLHFVGQAVTCCGLATSRECQGLVVQNIHRFPIACLLLRIVVQDFNGWTDRTSVLIGYFRGDV